MRPSVLALVILAAGCVGGPDTPPAGKTLAGDAAPPGAVARLQSADPPVPMAPSVAVPAPASGAVPVPEGPDFRSLNVRTRAWVNGRPIFDEEVLDDAIDELARNAENPEPLRTARRQEIFRTHLERLIEIEVIMQEVNRRLGKVPRVMDKLREEADKHFDKELRKWKRQFPDEVTFEQWLRHRGQTLKEMRKQKEREFLSEQYILSRIMPIVDSIGHLEIRQYFDEHLNEFQAPDRVEWQDLFIAVGPQYPTLAHARAFAEQLIQQLRAGTEFTELLKYVDGFSRYAKGKGEGETRGQIKPAEVEKYLWEMKDGEIGPPLELSTGVHVFRLVKRTYAGQLPFDEKAQTQIRNKLKDEIYKRERKRIIRELTARSVIQIERHPIP
jgi:hypothetical protein